MNAAQAGSTLDAPVDGRSTARHPRHPHRDRAERGSTRPRPAPAETAIELRDVSCYYGSFRAVKDVSVVALKREVTALIGPSGCGKSTLLRTFNRMNDLVPSFRSTGQVILDGQDLYGKDVDPVAVRRRVGMVFQKPNPFPKSIYENVAFGPRINGFTGKMDELVEQSLRRAALWDEVKDKLKESGHGALRRSAAAAVHRPDDRHRARGDPHGRAVLRARPAIDAADRGAHGGAQEGLHDRHRHPQHAAGGPRLGRHGDDDDGYDRTGRDTSSNRPRRIQIFTNPKNQLTEDYVSGRFG